MGNGTNKQVTLIENLKSILGFSKIWSNKTIHFYSSSQTHGSVQKWRCFSNASGSLPASNIPPCSTWWLRSITTNSLLDAICLKGLGDEKQTSWRRLKIGSVFLSFPSEYFWVSQSKKTSYRYSIWKNSWWFQPIWTKICSSNWIISPNWDEK